MKRDDARVRKSETQGLTIDVVGVDDFRRRVTMENESTVDPFEQRDEVGLSLGREQCCSSNLTELVRDDEEPSTSS